MKESLQLFACGNFLDEVLGLSSTLKVSGSSLKYPGSDCDTGCQSSGIPPVLHHLLPNADVVAVTMCLDKVVL